jgi:hypothetical protein
MAESSHWYDKTGKIVDCKPKEAKEKGYYPGVTMVLGIKNNFGLTYYTQQQHMEAVFNTPRLPNEELSYYFKRCRTVADHHRKSAAKIGSLFHTQMVRYFLEKHVLTGYNALVDTLYRSALTWVREHFLDTYMAEFPVVNHKYRYGGTIDWYGSTIWGDAVVDFKTRNIKHPGVKKDGTLKKIQGIVYDTDLKQLAAYKNALRKNCHLISIIASKNPELPGIFAHFWKKDEEIDGWRKFLATRKLYNVEEGI